MESEGSVLTYKEVEDHLTGPGFRGLVVRARGSIWKPGEAEWVVNLALASVLRKMKESGFVPFESVKQAQAYALTAVDWKVLDYQRIKMRERYQPAEEEGPGPVVVQKVDPLESKETLTEIEEAIKKLPTWMRNVWNLREREGLRFREIATRLGLATEWSASSIHVQAKKRLQLLLAPPREFEDMEIKQAEIALKKMRDNRRRRHD